MATDEAQGNSNANSTLHSDCNVRPKISPWHAWHAARNVACPRTPVSRRRRRGRRSCVLLISTARARARAETTPKNQMRRRALAVLRTNQTPRQPIAFRLLLLRAARQATEVNGAPRGQAPPAAGVLGQTGPPAFP